MTSDFTSTLFKSQFTATCNTGFAFFRSSGGNTFTASTTKTVTCNYRSSSSTTLWEYDDNTRSLDNCIGNNQENIKTIIIEERRQLHEKLTVKLRLGKAPSETC